MLKANPGSTPKLKRLGFRIASVWSLAWTLGSITLALLAVQLNERLVTQDLDSLLEVYAAATYGLTWFDEDGNFHGEIWQQDAVTWPEDLEIWIVRPTAVEPLVYLQPERPQFLLAELNTIASQVMESEIDVYRAGRDSKGQSYRLYARPTYQDARSSTPWAAVVVIGDAEPSRRAHRAFLRNLFLGVLVLGSAGLLVAVLLSRWSLQPVARSFQQRERFLAAAAHELRTPLAVLRSVCESATAGDEPPERALERLTDLVVRASETVDGLLLFARLEAETFPVDSQAVRLDLLVEACLPEDTGLQFEATPSVRRVDPTLFRAAVRNLIDNAQVHGGGPVGVRVVVTEDRILIEDRGPGFPAAVLQSRSVDLGLAPSSRGIGLGLTLVELVASLHGGSLQLSNRATGGARAVVLLGKETTL